MDTTLYIRQREVIRIQAIAVLFLMITVMALAYCYIQEAKVTDSQAALISASDERIAYLENQVDALQNQIDCAELEKAISTTRGSERPDLQTVTAYTWTGDKTASGTWPEEGRTVAGPRNVPFGTVVWIDGIGERIVEDRTHERFDGRWDVYMDKESDCLNWGIQEREVVVK